MVQEEDTPQIIEEEHISDRDEQIYESNENDPYKLQDVKPADPVKICDPGFIDIARLSGGGSFGALALLDGKPRMTTIKALNRCHLMILSRKDYNKTLDTIEFKKRMLKVNFMKTIPIFFRFTTTQLYRFTTFLQPFFCTKDHCLFREGDPADTVFIVKSG